MEKSEIPANLRAALHKIEANGTIPLLIPVALETFLTEQGLYSTSMTPDEAWQALQKLAGDAPTDSSAEKQAAEPVEVMQPSEEGETQEPSETDETPTKPKNKSFLPGFRGRRDQK